MVSLRQMLLGRITHIACSVLIIIRWLMPISSFHFPSLHLNTSNLFYVQFLAPSSISNLHFCTYIFYPDGPIRTRTPINGSSRMVQAFSTLPHCRQSLLRRHLGPGLLPGYHD